MEPVVHPSDAELPATEAAQRMDLNVYLLRMFTLLNRWAEGKEIALTVGEEHSLELRQVAANFWLALEQSCVISGGREATKEARNGSRAVSLQEAPESATSLSVKIRQ